MRINLNKDAYEARIKALFNGIVESLQTEADHGNTLLEVEIPRDAFKGVKDLINERLENVKWVLVAPRKGITRIKGNDIIFTLKIEA